MIQQDGGDHSLILFPTNETDEKVYVCTNIKLVLQSMYLSCNIILDPPISQELWSVV